MADAQLRYSKRMESPIEPGVKGEAKIRISPDFARLWAGQTISEVGSRISREGLPFTALIVLHASAGQMGILTSISTAAALLFGLIAGVIVDRLRKRPVMIATDLGRAALLGLIPLAALTHRLSFTVLIAVAALVGILTVHFDVAYQSYLPVLVERDEIFESNRRLSTSASGAELLGPALAGVLVQAITAPLAILVDALSFLVSAFSVWSIRKPEPQLQAHRTQPTLSESLEGLRFIWSHTALRALLLRSTTTFLFMGLIFALYLLSAIRVVHLSTSALGFAIALGGAGGLTGAWLVTRLTHRHGHAATFFLSAFFTGVGYLFIPLSAQFPRIGFLCLCIQQFFGDMAFTVYVVNETAIRQLLAPPQVMGRVNSVMQIASRGMLPFGALSGGFLAQRLGIAPTLWIGSGGVLLSTLWLLPLLRHSREIWTPSA
jgi:predicted MFS family arabinose efflux permease